MKKTTIFLFKRFYNELKAKVQSNKEESFHMSEDYKDSEHMFI